MRIVLRRSSNPSSSFPTRALHNHASMIVEAPNGDLLVCWFHGSGERTADDVSSRRAAEGRAPKTWSEPFLLADTPGYPDTNATMFIDPRQRLWLLWPTILANEWHTALMKVQDLVGLPARGPPRWEIERGAARARPATSSRRRSIASWIG
jgi:predicted neuraminidase